MKFDFKKIAPITTGAILLGTTIASAGVIAADVSYPNSFAGAVVVYGAGATADAAPANDIAADLGELTTGEAVTVDEGWEVKKGSTELNLNEDFADVASKIDNTEMSNALATGTYKDTKGTNKKDYTYDQALRFVAGGNALNYTQRSKGDDDKPMGYFVVLDKNIDAYNYTLEFDTGVSFEKSADGIGSD